MAAAVEVNAGQSIKNLPLIAIEQVTKSYFSGGVETKVLFGIELLVPHGDFFVGCFVYNTGFLHVPGRLKQRLSQAAGFISLRRHS